MLWIYSNLFKPHNDPPSRYCYFSHFVNEKTEGKASGHLAGRSRTHIEAIQLQSQCSSPLCYRAIVK